MPTDLPSDASPESRSRLASRCPPELASAIAVTGSVSRGYADRFSDIELYFQVGDLLPVAMYEAWLCALLALRLRASERGRQLPR